MFVGRIEEINRLLEVIQTEKQENIVIYGRRRIGKSELIKKVIEMSDVPYIYYQAKETTAEDNVESMSKLIAEKFNLGSIIFKSFEAIFEYIFEKSQGRLLFVIDEYPYLMNVSPGLDSIIQMIVDRYQQKSMLKMVLLGSFIDIMQSLNEPDKPLFGRITQMMFISELDYLETSLFYPNLSNEEKMMYYSAFGGVPYYNQMIEPNKTFIENISCLIIDTKGILSDFIEFFLSRELRRINNANAVLETIAVGKRKFNDILGRLQKNISSSQLSNVLDLLIRMDLIQKTTPINEPPHSRKTNYEIKDNYIRFYYQYIFRNLSERNILDPEVFYHEIIEHDFNTQFIPNVFEKVAMQYLVIQNRKKRIIPPLLKIGKYWYDNPLTKTNGEFDLVSEDKFGYIVYEAKYTNSVINAAIIQEEVNQLAACGISYYKLGFFSKRGFKLKKSDNLYLKSLDDLYL
jgi:uncharacterized protein